MGREWRECALGDIVELKRGYDLPHQQRQDGKFKIISSSGLSGFHNEAKVKGPGVVTGRYGTLGEVFYVLEDFWPLNTTLYVRDFKGNDPRFISYFLRSLNFFAYSDKAAVPGLNRNHLHQAVVSLPSDILEQRAIAYILGTLDDKIELNRRMSETLEAMARALFKSWFVDFEPVRAKAEGRDPDLLQPLTDLFPARLVDSEIGEIPEGWQVKTLPDLFEVNPPRGLKKGQTAPYLDMANMPTQGHSPGEVTLREFGSGMRFTNGDTLLARITPCLENGKTAFVDFLGHGEVGWGSTEYIVLRPKPPLPQEFGYCLARSQAFREFAIQSMTGSSGRQRVPADSLEHFRLAMPVEAASVHVTAAFGRSVHSLFARNAQAVQECRTLAAMRDALLPKLISGELRVRDAEKFLGRAA